MTRELQDELDRIIARRLGRLRRTFLIRRINGQAVTALGVIPLSERAMTPSAPATDSGSGSPAASS